MMKRQLCIALACTLALLATSAYAGPESTGFSRDTQILGTDGAICPDTQLLQNDDGSFENGYTWHFGGIQEPDYGAWAECYDAAFVCGIRFAFTQTGQQFDYTMDVYVWDVVHRRRGV